MDQDGAWGSGVADSLAETKRGFKNKIGMAKLPDSMDHILQSSSGHLPGTVSLRGVGGHLQG